MVIGVAVFELHIPHSHSLKQKRRVVKSMVERLHRRYKVSIAETGYHDVHQRAEIGLCLVARDGSDAWRRLDSIRRIVDEHDESVAISWDPDVLEVN